MAEKLPQLAESGNELARRVGVTGGTVTQWRHREDWPFGDAPYPVGAVRSWRERCVAKPPKNGKAVSSESTEELKRQLLREQIEKARRENQRMSGQLIDRDEAKTELEGILATLRSGLMAAASALPRTQQAQGMLRDGKRDEAVRLCESMMKQLAEQLQRDLRRLGKS